MNKTQFRYEYALLDNYEKCVASKLRLILKYFRCSCVYVYEY